ncbi:hypothetical protein GSI_15232 [Ganoderma sinense ZZ0214-1]|uniref:Uncharacterized protein n=1 Tax=Ganoderma sinense ZZ0214-1 TaxID=1077348 RepID=A0A2G8RM07_9APHY|nr:hypothetical protein GSI_15232 [Ganoderma sinense ZZ0214-1]
MPDSSSSSSSSTTSSSASTFGSSFSNGPSASPTTTDSGSNGTASATSGDASSTPGNGTGPLGPPSSSLYLFTFLATLFLLLAISSAIIMRGIFLRRRFRRRLEEALAAGAVLSGDDGPGGFGGRSHRRKVQRPTLYDLSVLAPYFSTSSPHDGNWEKLMPFSGNIHAEKPEAKASSATDTDPASSPAGGPRHRQPRIRAVLDGAAHLLPRNRLTRNGNGTRQSPSNPTSAPATAPSTGGGADDAPAIPLEQLDPVQRAAEVRVAVVIAMPNPHRSAYVPPSLDEELHQLTPGGKGKMRGLDGWGDEGEEEAGVPDVVFGVAMLPVTPPPPTPQESSSEVVS